MPTVQEIFEAIAQRAPTELQMDFDNSGFLLGHGDRQVHKVLLTLDITLPVIREAEELGAELIVSPSLDLPSPQVPHRLRQRTQDT